MFEFTYTRRKEDPIGAGKTEFEGGCEYFCIHPACKAPVLLRTDKCPYCGGNPFKLDEHEMFTEEQLAIQRAVQKKEELSH